MSTDRTFATAVLNSLITKSNKEHKVVDSLISLAFKYILILFPINFTCLYLIKLLKFIYLFLFLILFKLNIFINLKIV
jgi:hypothetical protein